MHKSSHSSSGLAIEQPEHMPYKTMQNSGSDTDGIVYPFRKKRRCYNEVNDTGGRASDPGPDTIDQVMQNARYSMADMRVSTSLSSVDLEDEFLMTCFRNDLEVDDASDSKGYRELILKNFVIYSVTADESTLLESLNIVSSNVKDEQSRKCFRFDGTLVSQKSGREVHLEGIELVDVQIDYATLEDGELNDDEFSTRNKVWIVSPRSSSYGYCYYRLDVPHPSYQQHFNSFVWLSDFIKLVFEYLEFSQRRKALVGLGHFREDFYNYLTSRYRNLKAFQQWHTQCRSVRDFRRIITCTHYASFIFDQLYNIQPSDESSENSSDRSDETISESYSLQAHPLWRDIGQDPAEIGQFSEVRMPCEETKPTVVTPNVANCFLRTFPSWGPSQYDLLHIEKLSGEVEQQWTKRRISLHLPDKYAQQEADDFITVAGRVYAKVELLLEQASEFAGPSPFKNSKDLVGRAVVIRDQLNLDAHNENQSYDYRFAYVRRIIKSEKLQVSWLTLPSRTSCSGRSAGIQATNSTFYPIGKELFFTDDCNCKLVSIEDVVASYSICINKDEPRKSAKLFAYQRSSNREHSFQYIQQETLDICLSCHAEQVSVPICKGPGYGGRTINNVSFCSGCGLLDNGMREGSHGMIQTRFTAEIDPNAVRSINANCETEDLHLKSQTRKDINDVIHALMIGKLALHQADCFTAGCPCQGFTTLNSLSKNFNGQKNCSLLAATLSAIELLLPKMLLIENVPNMDPKNPKRGHPSAAGQAICHLVSLGYQAKLCEVKASSLGAATSRRRLFIVASVPGIPLPETPGVIYGSEEEKSPLLTTGMVTSDLPSIANDTGICVSHPDHIPLETIDPFLLSIVEQIPQVTDSEASAGFPNLHQSRRRLNAEQYAWYQDQRDEIKQDHNSVLRRVNPDEPYGTITTRLPLLDTRRGPRIHWRDNRMLSLLELRRYHGVPDSYILIGNVFAQLKQLGNSVAWHVSMAWGKSFARSWCAAHGIVFNEPPDANTHKANTRAANVVDEEIDEEAQIKDSVEVRPKMARTHRIIYSSEEELEQPHVQEDLGNRDYQIRDRIVERQQMHHEYQPTCGADQNEIENIAKKVHRRLTGKGLKGGSEEHAIMIDDDED